MRIAPKSGYNTDIKAQYRENVWDAFAPGIADIIADTTGTLKAVIMPSSEGLEIEVALARGLRQEQIVCVDRSAAVIATSKWRKRWPDVKFFADEVATVGERIARKKWLVRVANLDLCGNFSDDTIEAVRGFLTIAPLHRKLSFAITMAKGREGAALTKLLHRVGAQLELGCPRMACLFEIFKDDVAHLGGLQCSAQGSYVASRVPMSWAVFSSFQGSGSMWLELNRLQIAPAEENIRLRDSFTPDRIWNLINLEIDAGIRWSIKPIERMRYSNHVRHACTEYKVVCEGRPADYEELLWGGQWAAGVRKFIDANFLIGHSILRKECFLCGGTPSHKYSDGRHICDSSHDYLPVNEFRLSPDGYDGVIQNRLTKGMMLRDIHFGSYVVKEYAWSGKYK